MWIFLSFACVQASISNGSFDLDLKLKSDNNAWLGEENLFVKVNRCVR